MSDHPVNGFPLPAVSTTTVWQFMRFILVGSAFAALYVTFATILTDWLGFTHWIASGFAYLVAIPLAYIAQKKFAFQSSVKDCQGFPRYLILQFFSLFSASGSAYLVSVIANFPTVFVYIVAASIAVVANFLLIKFWVLAEDEKL